MNRFKHTLLVAVVFAAVISLSACKDAIPSLPEELSTGTITGKAVYKNAAESSGITITLEKTDGLRSMSVVRSIELDVFDYSARSVAGNSTTDREGNYIFTNVEEGVYTIYASSKDSTEKAVTTNVVVEKNANVTAEDLKLTVTGNISGKITLNNSEIESYGFLTYVAGTSYSAMTDRTGAFTISGIPAGTGYSLIVTKQQLTYIFEESVTVTAKETVTVPEKNFTTSEITAGYTNGKDGTSISWLGSFASPEEIENPKYLDAYFNTADGCSYIYDGENWTLLATKGEKGENGTSTTGNDGISIKWLGSFASAEEIENPEKLNAFYNTTDGCSYICDGEKWDLLASKGDKGASSPVFNTTIKFIGEYVDAEMIADKYDLNGSCIFYNVLEKCNYIKTDKGWVQLGPKTESIYSWKGKHSSSDEIPLAKAGYIYYDTVRQLYFVYEDSKWKVFRDDLSPGVEIVIEYQIKLGKKDVTEIYVYYGLPSEKLEIDFPVFSSEYRIIKTDIDFPSVFPEKSMKYIGYIETENLCPHDINLKNNSEFHWYEPSCNHPEAIDLLLLRPGKEEHLFEIDSSTKTIIDGKECYVINYKCFCGYSYESIMNKSIPELVFKMSDLAISIGADNLIYISVTDEIRKSISIDFDIEILVKSPYKQTYDIKYWDIVIPVTKENDTGSQNAFVINPKKYLLSSDDYICVAVIKDKVRNEKYVIGNYDRPSYNLYYSYEGEDFIASADQYVELSINHTEPFWGQLVFIDTTINDSIRVYTQVYDPYKKVKRASVIIANQDSNNYMQYELYESQMVELNKEFVGSLENLEAGNYQVTACFYINEEYGYLICPCDTSHTAVYFDSIGDFLRSDYRNPNYYRSINIQ